MSIARGGDVERRKAKAKAKAKGERPKVKEEKARGFRGWRRGEEDPF
jgi:hypothetical protein